MSDNELSDELLHLWTAEQAIVARRLVVIREIEGRDTARREGAVHMDLGTSEDDVAARALYESLGFDNREGRPDGPINYFYEREL